MLTVARNRSLIRTSISRVHKRELTGREGDHTRVTLFDRRRQTYMAVRSVIPSSLSHTHTHSLPLTHTSTTHRHVKYSVLLDFCDVFV